MRGVSARSASTIQEPPEARPRISVVVALYNESEGVDLLARKLLPVLESLALDQAIELILIDDGSTDDTFARLRAAFGDVPFAGVRLLRHGANRGLGAALRTGFEAASGDIVCTFDCDCTYDPKELPVLIGRLVVSGVDIATGSPYHPEAGKIDAVPWRLFVSKSASWLYRRILPAKLYCYTSLFRAYRREWARAEFLESDGFIAVTEILATAALRGAGIIEFPVKLNARSCGKSKMKVAQTTLAHLRLMGRILFRGGNRARSPAPSSVPERRAG